MNLVQRAFDPRLVRPFVDENVGLRQKWWTARNNYFVSGHSGTGDIWTSVFDRRTDMDVPLYDPIRSPDVDRGERNMSGANYQRAPLKPQQCRFSMQAGISAEQRAVPVELYRGHPSGRPSDINVQLPRDCKPVAWPILGTMRHVLRIRPVPSTSAIITVSEGMLARCGKGCVANW